MEIGTATSKVTTPQLARELCGDGSGNVELQRCKLTLLQHCKLATLQAREAAHYKLATFYCCSSRCGSVTLLLQHVSRQRYCSSRRSNAAQLMSLLQFASWQHCAVRVATTLRSSRRCGTITTGVTLARVVAMASKATLLCRDGRWPASKFLFFFLLDSFKERTRARQREKRQGFETCFLALLVGLNVTQKLPLATTVVATCAPSLRYLR